MKALVTGATGFVGRALCARLSGAVVVLSRNPDRARQWLPGVTAFGWDPLRDAAPVAAFDGVDAIFHLAGEPVAGGRWTAGRRQRIHDSRVIGTRNLVEGIRGLAVRPRVLVSASAVGYYGSRGDEVLEEGATPATGFLPDVCRAWEHEAAAAEALGVRTVLVRTGLVLGRGGGALKPMAMAFRFGFGGRLGDGRQWMPWIHLDDEIGLLVHAAEHDAVRGAMNAVGPAPVRNADFTRALASAVHRPAFMHAPAFALRLLLGEMSGILLASQRAAPAVATRTGYRFQHTEIGAALHGLVG
jgi:hypothetical protein